MSVLMGALAVAAPEEVSENEDLFKTLPAVLGAITAIVGVVKLGAQRWLSRRSRSKQPIPPQVPNVLRVRTRNAYPTKTMLSTKRRSVLFWAGYFVFLASSFLLYGVAILVLNGIGGYGFDSGWFVLFGLGLLLAGVGFFVVSVAHFENFRKVKKKKPRDPLESQEISLVIDDAYDKVFTQAMRALVFVGGVTSAGTRIAMTPPRGGFLEGGMHGWPERKDGERIRITLGQANGSGYRVSVSSASFWPSLRSAKHEENRSEVLQFFLAHD
jgi:hypothetical protein